MIDAWLQLALEQNRRQALKLDENLAPLMDSLLDFTARPGKRIRPFLALWGYLGAGGVRTETVLPVCAAAELLHVFALAHDDVMDQSDLRRGLPTVHKQWAECHRATGWKGSPEQLGLSVAILLGDLALVVANGLLETAPLEAGIKDRVRAVWNSMREEVIEGQFLDVVASCRPEPASEAEIMSILSLKSGKYTLERPLHLGAAAAGASDHVLASLSAFGVPLGRAFQIQDDILGVFGSSECVGKPVDSDIKEGKSTLLVSRAYQMASETERKLILSTWGNPESSEQNVEELRNVICSTGALAYSESEAAKMAEEARCALGTAEITDECREILTGLAVFVLNRDS